MGWSFLCHPNRTFPPLAILDFMCIPPSQQHHVQRIFAGLSDWLVAAPTIVDLRTSHKSLPDALPRNMPLSRRFLVSGSADEMLQIHHITAAATGGGGAGYCNGGTPRLRCLHDARGGEMVRIACLREAPLAFAEVNMTRPVAEIHAAPHVHHNPSCHALCVSRACNTHTLTFKGNPRQMQPDYDRSNRCRGGPYT